MLSKLTQMKITSASIAMLALLFFAWGLYGQLQPHFKEVDCKIPQTTEHSLVEIPTASYAEEVNGRPWREVLLERVELHEGFSSIAYLDTDNRHRIGFGTPVIGDVAKARVTVAQARELARNQLTALEPEVRVLFKNFDVLDARAKLAVHDMAYNVGVTKLAKFKKMREYLDKGRYLLAAREMLNSKYATQVRSRAISNARLMASAKEVVSEDEIKTIFGI